MTDQLDAARRLYEAFAARDAPAILAALDDDFVGTVSPGMPLGVGGRHEGPITMLRDVWGPIFLAYEMRVEAERYYPSGDDHVIAVGHYRGNERESGRPVDAAFAHVLTVRDGRITALEQITDTARWRQAA